MQAIAVLRAEHDAVLVVLTELERAATAAEQGAFVPRSIFTDIQEFFTVFVDHCHHGKEEAELFSRMGEGAHAVVVQALALEHDTGRQRAAAYAAAVHSYVPGDRISGAQVARAARAYADLLRVHIEHETRDLFPAIAETLAAEDDQLVTAFERIEDEQIGAGTHERLHAMIDTLPGRISPWVRTPVLAD
ncbi:MAG TPA: hemerythrin domain-containing protein [Chloroflexota bacterium]|jgi:hemerythrin-like domain-containing protein